MTDAALKAAREALASLYELCLHGDFRNGVTDATGTIDEGDVRAGERIDKAKRTLALLDSALSAPPAEEVELRLVIARIIAGEWRPWEECPHQDRYLSKADKIISALDSHRSARTEPPVPHGIAGEFDRAVADVDRTIEEISKLCEGERDVWLLIHGPAIRKAREKAYADFANAVWSIREPIFDALRAAERGAGK